MSHVSVSRPGGTAGTAQAPPGEAGTPPPSPGGLAPHPFGVTGWARWGWRQLTSMRTALVLLFLLAAASVPGSVVPQQRLNSSGVAQYYKAHPALAPVLAKLGLFDVFGSPWFAAIYILLFISLIGCVLPRTWRLARSARALPPRAPRSPARLPLGARYETALAPGEAVAAAAALLRRRRFRVNTGDGWVSAEKGYRREVGNLLFHIALTGVLFSVALGGLFGYKAGRVLIAGQSYGDTASSLDKFQPGRLVGPGDLAPFTITLNHFSASYVMSGPQREQPKSFDARIHYTARPGGRPRAYDVRVNHPLSVDGTQVYLLGHGYAPVFKVTDARGQVVYDQATPFIPASNASFLSQGVVKVPDARPRQLGFAGIFVPTAVVANGRLASAFPAAYNPVVSMIAYSGNLGMNSGTPQSVYTLDTSGLRKLTKKAQVLTPGQSMTLPGGNGTLTFTGYQPWISLQTTRNPGQIPALFFGAVALAGLLLSFYVRRRRMFIRAREGDGGTTVVEAGGLARSDLGGGFEEEFAELAAALMSAHQAGPPPSGPPPAGTPGAGGDPAAPGKDPAPGTDAAAGKDPAHATHEGHATDEGGE